MYLPREIENVINETKEFIIDYFDPELIILSGSFGRDDWVLGENGELLSDIEMPFICSRYWNRKRTKLLKEKIKKMHGIDVCIFGISKRRFEKGYPKNLSFGKLPYLSLQIYETVYGSKILYKKTPNNILLPKLDVKHIPIWEGWRLIVNRMADVLKLERNDSDNIQNYFYWSKLVQACGDAFLIANKKYRISLKSRKNEIENLWSEKFSKDAPPKNIFLDPIINCYSMRQNHKICFSDIFSEAVTSENFNLVDFWFKYISNIMLNIGSNPDIFDIIKAYINNQEILKTYNLYYAYSLNPIIYTNIITIIKNIKSLHKYGFKYEKLKLPWLHILYILIILLYYDKYSSNGKYSKFIDMYLHQIIKKDYLLDKNKTDIVRNVIKLWKNLV